MLDRYMKVKIECDKNYGKEETFYFYEGNEEIPLVPNYCEQADGGEICKKCAVKALNKLIKKLNEKN